MRSIGLRKGCYVRPFRAIPIVNTAFGHAVLVLEKERKILILLRYLMAYAATLIRVTRTVTLRSSRATLNLVTRRYEVS
jgi:hypothetical protein